MNRLTDEEIVKAFEHCNKSLPHDKCLLAEQHKEDWVTCQSKCGRMIIDLIHRLQGEKAEVDEYRRKIEQGTLIELPCKVGDTVYLVYSFSGICEWEVDEIVIMRRTIRLRLTHKGTKDFNFALLTENGETLFFTRKEAEKRLKELRNG